jgi:hypothetical protein
MSNVVHFFINWMHFSPHLLINHEFLRSWSFSFSYMICSSHIITFFIIIVWTCTCEVKCSTCHFLHIYCRPSFNHAFCTTLVYKHCSFRFPLDLTCFTTWFEVIIKWSFGFLYILMNKLVGELERRSHTLVVSFNSILWNARCVHVGYFPWRWNAINVHKIQYGF